MNIRSRHRGNCTDARPLSIVELTSIYHNLLRQWSEV
jgi:predicted 2-oxoglutarate/Fe(II)-dependent dioxygenase YbiX